MTLRFWGTVIKGHPPSTFSEPEAQTISEPRPCHHLLSKESNSPGQDEGTGHRKLQTLGRVSWDLGIRGQQRKQGVQEGEHRLRPFLGPLPCAGEKADTSQFIKSLNSTLVNEAKTKQAGDVLGSQKQKNKWQEPVWPEI